MKNSYSQWIRSAIFTVFMFVSVPFYAFIVLVSFWGNWEIRFVGVRLWIDTIMFLLRRVCGLSYVVEGRENLPNTSAVIMMKHASAWETIAQMQIFGKQTWVLKRELMWAPFLGWVLKLLKPIAINRKAGRSAIDQVISQGKQKLADGFNVIIFPEGTRVPVGETKRYGLGGALLAIAADQPVIPVVHNAGYYWPRRGFIKRPGQIRVVIGEAIPTAGRDPKAVTKDVQTFIERTLENIKPSQSG